MLFPTGQRLSTLAARRCFRELPVTLREAGVRATTLTPNARAHSPLSNEAIALPAVTTRRQAPG